MKGKYINTIIMQALLAGNRRRKTADQQEVISSLDDHKIIWRKEVNTITKTNNSKQAVVTN
jgi:hypothetical protein